MAENVEVLRGAYAAFGRGDMKGVTDTWEADIEFAGPNSSRMPGAGPHRGKEEVAHLFSGMRRCRGSITGWKDLLVAPYLRTMDDEIRRVLPQAAGRQPFEIAKTKGGSYGEGIAVPLDLT